MSDTILRVENIGKKYTLRHQQGERYTALRDVLVGNVRSIGRKLRPGSRQSANLRREEFWALKNVSFEIKRGDVVGIIGRNGAGKSTLLKILSRITPPTTGRIEGKGRVASLLEVGTGFHPELTGRENIYLNGAILGMSRTDIRRKFDEIVDFAEVEKFLDTPVKRYSSGMYVRLAFAVAAHLEPEILVVDEVLAVGDAAFQKKCLGKMSEVSSKEGRTVLFVSHNMAAIRNLCHDVIFLNAGKIVMIDQTDKVIDYYMNKATELLQVQLEDRQDRSGDGSVRFTSVILQNSLGETVQSFYSGQDVKFVCCFDNKMGKNLRNFHLALSIDSPFGERITVFSNQLTGQVFEILSKEINCIEIRVPRLPLNPGRYTFTIFSEVNNVIADWVQNAASFDVEAGDFFGTGKLPPDTQGNFLVDHGFVAKPPIQNNKFVDLSK